VHEAALKNGIQSAIIKNHELIMSIRDGKPALELLDRESKFPDFAVFFDKDLLLARHLEEMGIAIYNRAHAIELCDNKAKTFQVLAGNGIPLPYTIIAPKTYAGTAIQRSDYNDHIIAELGFPLIIKEVHGSFGAQVYLIENRESFNEKVEALCGVSHIFQKFIGSSFGRDIRVNVVGGAAVAAMYRYSSSDFRANVINGAQMKPHNLTKHQAELSVRCAQLLGADFAGIDLLFDEHENPLVCEVNSNAYIRNITTCTGIDVAGHMISHILKKQAPS